jgi:hypothetical protein
LKLLCEFGAQTSAENLERKSDRRLQQLISIPYDRGLEEVRRLFKRPMTKKCGQTGDDLHGDSARHRTAGTGQCKIQHRCMQREIANTQIHLNHLLLVGMMLNRYKVRLNQVVGNCPVGCQKHSADAYH